MIKLIHGDCLDVMKKMKDNCIDSIVTDPPYGLSKQPDMQEVLSHWLNDTEYEHGGTGFMGKCFHPDTLILTWKGWKNITTVQSGDNICTLNPETNLIEYVRCKKTFTYDFNGILAHIHGRSVEQKITFNHEVVTKSIKTGKLQKCTPPHLPKSFIMVNQGQWNGKTSDEIVIEGHSFPSRAFFLFLGLFLGDGYTVNRVHQPEKQDFFGFGIFKDRKIQLVRRALEELGIHFSENVNQNKHTFYVYHKGILKYLKCLGKASDKYIPNELFEWDASILEYLYQGMINSDGSIQGVNLQHVYYTISNKLADDFQRLCLHTGRSCVKTQHQNSTSSFKPDGYGWVLSVTQPNKRFWLERINHKNPMIHNYDEISYVGKVHCVEAEKNHIVLSRYNGRTVWSGNSWDSFVPGPLIWKECLRVLKPGGHLLAFAGTRTQDLMALSIRLAGFEIRDMIAWVYGSGFPKSLNIGKAVDKLQGNDREVAGKYIRPDGTDREYEGWQSNNKISTVQNKAPATAECRTLTKGTSEHEGWGTNLKPALEPITLARKPLSEKTIAANVLKWGTGGIAIDACRVETVNKIGRDNTGMKQSPLNQKDGWNNNSMKGLNKGEPQGRFPANLILDNSDEVVELFPDTKSGALKPYKENHQNASSYHLERDKTFVQEANSGSASRFFKCCPPDVPSRIKYCAKASKKDRHPLTEKVFILKDEISQTMINEIQQILGLNDII